MASDAGRSWRVGLLVLVALAVLAAGIFLIGEKNQLFSLKSDYFTRFGTVSGLNPGNPVHLNGVEVGSVTRIVLPEDPGERLIRVELTLEQRYGERIRADSEARLKTLGLLGDKYIEITSGSADAPLLPEGSEIPAATPTELDALVASGEDVMANITEISSSLKVILARMEAGEGLLGELISDPETGQRVTDRMMETFDSIQQVAERIEHGDGVIPRLITDPDLADRTVAAVERLEGILGRFEEGEGLLPSLLEDPSTKESFNATLASLEATSEELAEFSRAVRQAEGLLPQLLFDKEYGEEVTGEIEQAVERINLLAAQLEAGEGTLGQLMQDPSVYEAVNDILIGINESKLLRWLIRNRQKKGIEKRYEEAQEEPRQEGEAPPPPP